MKSYFYSIFVRSFLAFSGFAVFLLTATLFGSDGRGTIGYGTSLFAVLGMICSANLGRAFISRTQQADILKTNLLSRFLRLNINAAVATAVTGVLYWYFSDTAQQMLSFKQVILFAMTSLYYVWNINGNAFFAAFIATKKQENIILVIRLVLFAFLVGLYSVKTANIDLFIAGYSFLLLIGPATEMFYLFKIYSKDSGGVTRQPIWEIVRESFYHHIDFLAFNSFPLVATVLLASYVSKSDVGRFNFALQILNLVFLFSATAHIRLMAYVSDVGFRTRLVQYKKLFWATLVISAVSVCILYGAITFITQHSLLAQFEGVADIFLICGLSVPGYIFYQFFSPIWIELKKEKLAAFLHGINFLFFLMISPFCFEHYGVNGAAWVLGLFHCGLLVTQAILCSRYFKDEKVHAGDAA